METVTIIIIILGSGVLPVIIIIGLAMMRFKLNADRKISEEALKQNEELIDTLEQLVALKSEQVQITAMKTTTLLLLFVTVTSWAQLPKDATTGMFIYQEVVNQEGTPEELYRRAREWFVHAYKDANKVIQMDDKEGATIIGKGKFTIYLSMNNRFVQHTVTIEAKENRYRYTITNFILDWGDGVSTVPFESAESFYQKKLYSQTSVHVEALIKELKVAMNKQKTEW